MSRASDCDLLSISTDHTRDELRAHYHALAARAHPDHGGDPDRFAEIAAAYRRLAAIAPDRRACKSCEGSGRVPIAGGFNPLKILCKACSGSGVK